MSKMPKNPRASNGEGREARGSDDDTKENLVSDEVLYHDNTLWNARPWLGEIRDYARSGLVSPWGVLGVVMARAVANTMPSVTLPDTIGKGAGSLNLMVALVGASGEGKSITSSTARNIIPPADQDKNDKVREVPQGTGEGLLKSYVQRVGKPGEPKKLVQHTHRVYMEVDEIDTLAALGNRSGATIFPVLRSAWSGSILGFNNSDERTRLFVDPGKARLGVITCVQPLRSEGLFTDAGGGTPQRFLWLPVSEGEHTPDEDIEADVPDVPVITPRKPLTVSDKVRMEIRANRRNRLKGIIQVDPLDAHHDYVRFKVAGALTILDGKTHISDEMWALAGIVMQVSVATRQVCLDAVREESMKNARDLGARDAARAIAKRDAEARVDNMRDDITKSLESCDKKDGMTHSGLQKAVASAETKRDLYQQVIEDMVAKGEVTKHEYEYRGRPAARYTLP